jgi:protein-tyrosine phosphatase
MIDLHCHILPGLDDGPRDVDQSLEMARAQVEAGVHTVVATPHVAEAFPDNDADRIAAATTELAGALRAAGIPLVVLPGAEVSIPAAVEMDDAELRRLGLGDSRWILLEAPHTASASGTELALRHLQDRGHLIVIAHPERCPDFQRRPDVLPALLAEGKLAQVTASALVGAFGSRAERLGRQLVADGLAHVAASDAHGVARRGVGLISDIRAARLAPRAAWLTTQVPGAILSGSPIPAPPPLPRRRRGMAARLGLRS